MHKQKVFSSNETLLCTLLYSIFAETHINQLQYRLEKLKEEQGDHEQIIREQISELESKNNT